ncbi:hypothetical protein ACJMK2_010230 [Sinanodonta woodiana]|uniref:Uncharacterized protein n=1 Tax=Sinanodonta woodiana TaxID=1069815 RepID=A0ABD3VEP3_SINWO
MTIYRLKINCTNMTMPGQLGVAVGRAKSKTGLRVQNFRPCLVRSQPQFIKTFYKSQFCPLDETCCRKPFSVDHSICPEDKQECARHADTIDDNDDVEEKDIENDSDDDEDVIKQWIYLKVLSNKLLRDQCLQQ